MARGAPRTWLQRILALPHPVAANPIDPVPCRVPRLQGAEIAALYYDLRRAGDFYEFLRAGQSRLIFALLDMAGRREDTRDILRAAQKTLREGVARLFSADDLNETIAMMELARLLNRTILSGGIRACPGFLGCYNEEFGTICYANAGHPPALVRDRTAVSLLPANGLPLGLFSHVPQSASTCVLLPEAALLVVSRGILEAQCHGNEFGLEGVSTVLRRCDPCGAHALCGAVLRTAQGFSGAPLTQNDVTALALVRTAPE